MENKEIIIDRLKQIIPSITRCDYVLEKQLKRKEQECEKLNKQVNDLLNKPEIQDKILWKIDNKALLESKDAWIYKLEQTLTEIKEIADKDFRHTAWEEYAKQLKQILQKISEVNNDR